MELNEDTARCSNNINDFEETKMKEKIETEKMLADYYETAQRSFLARTESENDEELNLKFKIAVFVIHELSSATPAWFENHFLANIAKESSSADAANEEVQAVEDVFYEAVADHLIKMESEVDYAKNALAPLIEEWDKKDFWRPIVFDAFLIVGIYLTSSPKTGVHNGRGMKRNKPERNISPRYLYHTNFRLSKDMLTQLL